MKKLSIILALLVVVCPVRSDAIIPLVLALAPYAAEIAVGQFAAAGIARVINPTTTKTMSIPKGTRSLKVSFGIVSSVVGGALALDLFAKSAGYASGAKGPVPTSGGISASTFCDSLGSSPEAWVATILAKPAYSGTTVIYTRISASNIDINFVGKFVNHAWGCSSVSSAPDVMWLDNSTNITQAKTDNLVSSLKAFAVSNPSAFAKIASMSDTVATQRESSYPGLSGGMSVDAAGNMFYNGVVQNGATFVDSAGVSHVATINSNQQLLIDGGAQTGFTASNPTNPVGTLPNTAAPSGNTASTSGDLGSVVNAINNAKNQAVQDSAFVVGSVDAVKSSIDTQTTSIVDAIKKKKTDCDKFPKSVGCVDLGTAPLAGILPNKIIDFSTGITPINLGIITSGQCPAPVSIVMSGQTVAFSYDPLCQFMSGIKPFVLAFAWLSAGLLFFSAVRT